MSASSSHFHSKLRVCLRFHSLLVRSACYNSIFSEWLRIKPVVASSWCLYIVHMSRNIATLYLCTILTVFVFWSALNRSRDGNRGYWAMIGVFTVAEKDKDIQVRVNNAKREEKVFPEVKIPFEFTIQMFSKILRFEDLSQHFSPQLMKLWTKKMKMNI